MNTYVGKKLKKMLKDEKERLEELDIEMVSTGVYVQRYFNDYGISLSDLAEVSGVSLRTIYRFINGEIKISTKIAEGVHQLINGISVKFLLQYDAAYQYQKELAERKSGLTEKQINTIASKYSLKKFFPSIKGGSSALCSHLIDLFGKDELANKDLSEFVPANISFSKANNSDEEVAAVWVAIALKEAQNELEPLRVFSLKDLKQNMQFIPSLAEAITYEHTRSNMDAFCSLCGINFHFRNSVPNSRIKGLVTEDSNGYVYLLMSDLFKCIERYWFTFIHELLHIVRGDLERNREISLEKDESAIDDDVIRFLVKDDMSEKRYYSLSEIKKISKEHNVPIGLVAEIARFRSGNYSDYSINQLVHNVKVVKD